jgi:hypothetical protein
VIALNERDLDEQPSTRSQHSIALPERSTRR